MKSCREISELVSRSLDEPLGLTARLQVRLHLLFCEGCRRMEQQLRFVQRACRELAGKIPRRPE